MARRYKPYDEDYNKKIEKNTQLHSNKRIFSYIGYKLFKKELRQ